MSVWKVIDIYREAEPEAELSLFIQIQVCRLS